MEAAVSSVNLQMEEDRKTTALKSLQVCGCSATTPEACCMHALDPEAACLKSMHTGQKHVVHQ